MRRLACAVVLALLAAGAAHAQAQKVYRCVDERGRTYYTEKPSRNCKATNIGNLPEEGAVPRTPAAQALPKAPSARQASRERRPVSHCDSLRNAEASLTRGATGDAAANAYRLAGIQKALDRDCAAAAPR